MELSGGQPVRRRSRRGAVLAALAAAVAAGLLAGCGGDDDSAATTEAEGPYRAEVVRADFPPRQRLGETKLMRVAVRNSGEETIPELTIAVTVGGKQGRASALPFGVRDPQPDLAEPDRPVWVLAEHYPKEAGATGPGGAETSTSKVFSFGSLEPGRTLTAVWKLTASREGRYRLHYAVADGTDGTSRVENAAGVEPGGSFDVEISEKPVATTVTDDGRVVEIDEKERSGR